MDLQQTSKILATIWELYPSFGDGRNIPKMAKTWQTIFADDKYDDVSDAVTAYACRDERGFPPHVGAIKELLWQQKNPYISESSAWAIVKKSIGGSPATSADRFYALPISIQKAVGDPSTLRKWGSVEEEHLETVVGSNFRRAYREIIQREKSVSKLPLSVRAAYAEVLPLSEYKNPGSEQVLPKQECVQCPDKIKKQTKERLG